MTGTPTQGRDAPTELPRSQHAFAPELLLRLLRPGPAQTSFVTSPDTLSPTIINTAQILARHAKATTDRLGRLEMLNDVTGRELKVFRKSPCPPRARNSSPASSDEASDGACASKLPWREAGPANHHDDKVDSDRELDGVETDAPIDRAGRFEALNDGMGRTLRVFRKSPCPPRARNPPRASSSPASGGAHVAECSSDVAGKLPWREAGPPNHHDDKVDSDREVKVTPCLHLGMRPHSSEDAVG